MKRRPAGLLTVDSGPAPFCTTFDVAASGEGQLLGIFSGADKMLLRDRAASLADAVEASSLPGVSAVRAGNHSVRISFAPGRLDPVLLRQGLRRLAAALPGTAQW
jgi:allophanate hydrolase subunit 1